MLQKWSTCYTARFNSLLKLSRWSEVATSQSEDCAALLGLRASVGALSTVCHAPAAAAAYPYAFTVTVSERACKHLSEPMITKTMAALTTCAKRCSSCRCSCCCASCTLGARSSDLHDSKKYHNRTTCGVDKACGPGLRVFSRFPLLLTPPVVPTARCVQKHQQGTHMLTHQE